MPYGLVGLAILVVSRFFLAVPAVILDDCRVGQAMFRSDKLTQGKLLTLAALISLIDKGYLLGGTEIRRAARPYFQMNARLIGKNARDQSGACHLKDNERKSARDLCKNSENTLFMTANRPTTIL